MAAWQHWDSTRVSYPYDCSVWSKQQDMEELARAEEKMLEAIRKEAR